MKVFISHSTYDKWVARQISRLIEAEGHQTFLDEKDIKTGESIDASIQEHLKDCDHLFLLITPASLKSHWVFVELGGAKALGKHVVPILMHVGSNELPGPIASLLAREINDLDKYIAELKASTLKGATNSAKQPKAAHTTAKAKAAEIAPKSAKKTLGLFSVGDEVRIAAVEHLTPEDKAKSPKWVSGMDKFSGVVTRITAFTPGGAAYLAATGDVYRWNLDWLTKAA